MIIQDNNNQVTNPVQNDTSFNLQDILYQLLSKWYWFLISLAITVGIALVYLLSTPPVYTRSISMLIKEDGKGGSMSGDVGSAFSDMGLFQSGTNVNNEIHFLRSSALMLDVVKRLHLDVTYKTDGRFYEKVLYGQELPYNVRFLDLADNETASFTLQPESEGQLQLTDFVRNGIQNEASTSMQGRVNDTLATPAGRVLITPVPYYKDKEHPVKKIYVSRATLHGTTAAYAAGLGVGMLDDKTTIIKITFNDVCIQRAEDILNTVVAVYNENWVKDRNQIAISTSLFINERLGVIERELGHVDEDISSFKSEHLLPDVQAAAGMYMSQSSEINAQILNLNTQLAMVRYIRNYLSSDDKRLLPVISGLEANNIGQQVGEYNTLMLQRNSLIANSSEQNPLVTDIDQTLEALRKAILSSIDNQVAALNIQINSLQHQERQTNKQIAASPSQAKYLLSVERQQKVKEALYLFLLQKREENELSQAFTAYNTRIIAPPGGSMAPTAPAKQMVLLIAIIIGLVIPGGIIFLREALNTTVRGRKDLENIRLPFVGEIPQAEEKKKTFGRRKETEEAIGIVVKDKSRDVVNEAFRVARTNLEFMLGNAEQPKLIMTTSMNPGSGKTFITANMAASLAVKGKKVVAIDLDLRRASLSKYIGSPAQGISNYLAGQEVSLSSILIPAEHTPSLTIIPVGTIPPNPTELLFSERLQPLLDTLRKTYDYIFIDCPPVEVVADAAIIGKMVDMTLFVVRAGLLERNMLPQIEKLHAESKYKNMSVILNGTEAAYGRHSKYGYRYGYNYGYGNTHYYNQQG